MRPRDLGRMTLLRSPVEVWAWIRLFANRVATPAAEPEPAVADAAAYADQLKKGIAALFEPRRETCPVCESSQLKQLLSTIDVVQRKHRIPWTISDPDDVKRGCAALPIHGESPVFVAHRASNERAG